MNSFTAKINTMHWKLISTVLVLSALSLISVVYFYKVDALLSHLWKTQVMQKVYDKASLNLDDYQVEIEGKKIIGVNDDISGLTFNIESNTLYSVLNGKPFVVEMDLKGNVLRTVKVDGVHDMEGITHVDKNRYVVADEYDQKLILLEIDDYVEVVDATQAPQISLGITSNGNNKDFEGVSWDQHHKRLLVVKERDPLGIIEITGFVEDKKDISQLRISQIKPADPSSLKLRDFSSVTYHDPNNHLVVLSDESKMAVEYDSEGHTLSALALWQGFHGLNKNVPQAEGIAIGPDNRVYIVSEPNLFYAFAPAN